MYLELSQSQQYEEINKCMCHGVVILIYEVYPAVPAHRLWQQLMSGHIFLCQ